MKKTILILVAILLFNCSSSEETENLVNIKDTPFTGTWKFSKIQEQAQDTCEEKPFMVFSDFKITNIWYDQSCLNEIENNTLSFELISKDIIKRIRTEPVYSTKYIKILGNNSIGYKAYFSVQGSTDDNIIFEKNGKSEFYNIKR